MLNQTKIKIIQNIYRSFKKLKEKNNTLPNHKLLENAIAHVTKPKK